MSSNNILEQVRKLVELQKIDAEIYGFKRELEEKPPYLAKIKEEFESKKTKLKTLEDKYKSAQVVRNSFEVDLKTQDDAIAKANSQLSQLKTNKEYSAKMLEIENIKADKSIIEEKILLSYDETDALKVSMDKEKQSIVEYEKNYLQEKKSIEDGMREIEERIKALDVQRIHVTPGIEKFHLDRYQKILVNKHGLALVPVQGSVCGGCFMNVPAQVVNEIKMHDQLIYCEICARILYLEEDIP